MMRHPISEVLPTAFFLHSLTYNLVDNLILVILPCQVCMNSRLVVLCQYPDSPRRHLIPESSIPCCWTRPTWDLHNTHECRNNLVSYTFECVCQLSDIIQCSSDHLHSWLILLHRILVKTMNSAQCEHQYQ